MSLTATPKDLSHIFRSKIENWELSRAEETNRIPLAERQTRGKAKVRVWTLEQLPMIGDHFGWLKRIRPAGSPAIIISIFMPKGGVLKSTLAVNLARALALNGRKTLLIGLDMQGTATDMFQEELQTLQSMEEPPGLYEYFREEESKHPMAIGSLIKKSNLPTLDYIPESPKLASLEKLVSTRNNPNEWIATAIEPLRTQYEVILFDNSPNFYQLSKSSLKASEHIIIPMSCEIGCLRSVATNMDLMDRFLSDTKHKPKGVHIIPTKKSQTNLSSEIEATYRSLYTTKVTLGAIRTTTKGENAHANNASIFEIEPKSDLANDYYSVISELWTKIGKTYEKEQ